VVPRVVRSRGAPRRPAWSDCPVVPPSAPCSRNPCYPAGNILYRRISGRQLTPRVASAVEAFSRCGRRRRACPSRRASGRRTDQPSPVPCTAGPA